MQFGAICFCDEISSMLGSYLNIFVIYSLVILCYLCTLLGFAVIFYPVFISILIKRVLQVERSSVERQ